MDSNTFNEHKPKLVTYHRGQHERDLLELGERVAGTLFRENTGPKWQRECSLFGRIQAAERRWRERHILVRHRGQWRTLESTDNL